MATENGMIKPEAVETKLAKRVRRKCTHLVVCNVVPSSKMNLSLSYLACDLRTFLRRDGICGHSIAGLLSS